MAMTARIRGLNVTQVTAGFALLDSYGTPVLSTYSDDLDEPGCLPRGERGPLT